MMRDCYILQVMTGREAYYITHAYNYLGKDRENLHLFVPRREMTIRRKGKRLVTRKPIFPGYVFWECDEPEEQIQWRLKRTPGFIRFLRRESGVLSPISAADRKLITHLITGGDICGASQITFDRDNRIVALSGPLKGYEGSIIKVDRRKQRAQVKFLLNDKTFLIYFEYREIRQADMQ